MELFARGASTPHVYSPTIPGWVIVAGVWVVLFLVAVAVYRANRSR
jgi:hypothetical protein